MLPCLKFVYKDVTFLDKEEPARSLFCNNGAHVFYAIQNGSCDVDRQFWGCLCFLMTIHMFVTFKKILLYFHVLEHYHDGNFMVFPGFQRKTIAYIKEFIPIVKYFIKTHCKNVDFRNYILSRKYCMFDKLQFYFCVNNVQFKSLKSFHWGDNRLAWQLKVVKTTYHQVQTLVIRSVRATSCHVMLPWYEWRVLLFEQCQHTAPSQPFHRQLSGWYLMLRTMNNSWIHCTSS